MRMQSIKRAAIAGVALAAAAAMLAGCTAGGSSSSSSGKHVTITFQSLAFASTTIKATKNIVASFNKSHPDITVKLHFGSWDNVHDQLVTEFQGNTAPDVIGEASDDIQGFAQQGYLANLKPYLSKSVVNSVSKGVWGSVTLPDGSVFAAPTLLQTYVVFVNTDALKAAGVTAPTGSSMNWSDFTSMAQKLTGNGKYGLDWPLASPTATVMNLSLNYGGTFFKTAADGTTSIKVTDKELQVPEQIEGMIANKSLDPVSVTQNGSDALPAFFSGKDAMYVGGNYIAQQISSTAPAGFHWSVLPTLTGTVGAGQAADPQTMSVSAQSKYIKQSAEFVNYFMGAANQAALAQGDWLIPASAPAKAIVEKQTGGKNGWDVALTSGKSLVSAPFLSAVDYPQWNQQVATPAFQEYFAGKITKTQLANQLTSGWKSITGQ